MARFGRSPYTCGERAVAASSLHLVAREPMSDPRATRLAYLAAAAPGDNWDRFQRARYTAAAVAHYAQHVDDRDAHNAEAVRHYEAALGHIAELHAGDQRDTLHHSQFPEWHKLVAAIDVVAYKVIYWIESVESSASAGNHASVVEALSQLSQFASECSDIAVSTRVSQFRRAMCVRAASLPVTDSAAKRR